MTASGYSGFKLRLRLMFVCWRRAVYAEEGAVLVMGAVGGQIPHNLGNQRMFPITGAPLTDAKCYLLKMKLIKSSCWGIFKEKIQSWISSPSPKQRGTETETEPSTQAAPKYTGKAAQLCHLRKTHRENTKSSCSVPWVWSCIATWYLLGMWTSIKTTHGRKWKHEKQRKLWALENKLTQKVKATTQNSNKLKWERALGQKKMEPNRKADFIEPYSSVAKSHKFCFFPISTVLKCT